MMPTTRIFCWSDMESHRVCFAQRSKRRAEKACGWGCSVPSQYGRFRRLLCNRQPVEDVRLALEGTVPVEFYGRTGGNVPSVEEILAEVLACMASLV
jgi:hypothetical protein